MAFKELGWGEGQGEKIADNTERSIRYRKRTYGALNDIDTDKLKEFSKIIMLSGQTQGLFNTLNFFGTALDDMIVCLYPKKDILDKLEISDLQKLKNLLEKLLSTKADVSKMLNQLLLDYQNNENSIQKDTNKLKSYVITLCNQTEEKQKEAENLKNEIFTIQKKL